MLAAQNLSLWGSETPRQIRWAFFCFEFLVSSLKFEIRGSKLLQNKAVSPNPKHAHSNLHALAFYFKLSASLAFPRKIYKKRHHGRDLPSGNADRPVM